MKKISLVVTLFAAAMLFLTTGALAQNSPDCSAITPSGGGTLTTNDGTWSWGSETQSYPADWFFLLNGNGAGEGLFLEVANGGQMYMNDGTGWWLWNGGGWGSGSDPGCLNPVGVSAPSGYYWTNTFDDEFTQDSSLNTNVWNGGAGNTDWCDNGGGAYMFREDESTECDQHYDGLALAGSSGLQFTSPGYPSAAIQTSNTFSQQFGYWESSFEVPTGDGGGYLHSDFWMHPIPETISGCNVWTPEIDVGERPSWLGSGNNNTQMSFGINDCGESGGGLYGDVAGDDLSQNFHTYGMWWNNDGSGPYGSIQMYLDGAALFSSPYVLDSNDSNMANAIYMFLSLDNDSLGSCCTTNPFQVLYVRVWQLN